MKKIIITSLAGLLVATSVYASWFSNIFGGNVNIDPLPIDNFLGLSDTPNSYSGQSGKCAAVNGAENSLEFTDCGETLPQDLYATSSPTFAGLTLDSLNGLLTATNGVLGTTTASAVGGASPYNLFLLDTPSDITGYELLSGIPGTGTEDSDATSTSSGLGEVLLDDYITGTSTPGMTVIPSGLWEFQTYLSVDSTVGVTQVISKVYSRTTGGTETLLFSATSPEFNSATATLVDWDSVQPDFAINDTDRLVVKYYAITTSVVARTVTIYYEGTTHYSHIHTPLIRTHNQLAGLQGGTTDQYYHLTSSQYTVATQAASGSQNGYLTSTDWTTFNNKLATTTWGGIGGTLSNQSDLQAALNGKLSITATSSIDHNTLANLTVGDVHTQYALLAGRSGGQTIIGGTAASNNLTLQSTSNATKGKILFGTSAYDEVNNRLGIGTTSPAVSIEAKASGNAGINLISTAGHVFNQYQPASNNHFSYFNLGDGGTFGWQMGKDINAGSAGGANGFYIYEFNTGTMGARFAINKGGNVGIGVVNSTAVLHLKAGTATAGTAPLKLTSGTLLTTPEAGALEFLTDKLYFTITTGAARKTIAFLESPAFVTPSLGAATGLTIQYESKPATNQTVSGSIATSTVSVNSTGFGALLSMNTSGSYVEASASVTTTLPVVAMAVETGTGTKKVITDGYVRNDTWDFDTTKIGQPLYLPTATGTPTSTPPSGSGKNVQIIGVIRSADEMYFRPEFGWLGL